MTKLTDLELPASACDKLWPQGIKTVSQFYHACDNGQADEIKDLLQIGNAEFKTLVDTAGLLLVYGIGPAVIRVLNSIGIHSLSQLAEAQGPISLSQGIAEKNKKTQRRIIKNNPSPEKVEKWIRQAKELLAGQGGKS